MVAIAAGLGVLNTVLMTTRDRVHDLGVFKALGMRPGQLLTMVVCWIVGPAVVAGAIAAPAAMALNTATVNAMAGTAHTGVPAFFTQVFPPSRLALLSLAALVLAVAGALAPASWAARARPAAPDESRAGDLPIASRKTANSAAATSEREQRDDEIFRVDPQRSKKSDPAAREATGSTMARGAPVATADSTLVVSAEP